MARITYSAFVEKISGSVGGTTFQKNAYGYTCKKKPNMVRPWTVDQVFMQQAFSRAVKAWKVATSTTRANWETWATTNPQYAKHNPSAVLGGFACFVKWHFQQFLSSSTVDTSPTLVVPDQPPVTYKLILSGGVLSIDVDCDDGAEDWNLNLFLSRPLGASQNFIGTKCRFIIKLSDADQTVPVTSLYTAKFGSLPALGDRIALDAVPFMESGGAVTARVQSIITVTAS